MLFRNVVKVIAVLVEIILALVILVVFTAFALQPTELLIFTNALILVMIMVQLYTVNTLTDLYEEIDKIKVVKKK
ncbi:MAG: hypothetical protein ABIE55_00235 [Candidatus Aenigmatarchaeota archaeon]